MTKDPKQAGISIQDYYATSDRLSAEQIVRGIREVNDATLARPGYVLFSVLIDGKELNFKAVSIMGMAGGGVGVLLDVEGPT